MLVSARQRKGLMNVPVVALVAGRMAPARDDLWPMYRSDSGHAEQSTGNGSPSVLSSTHMGWPFLSRGSRLNHPKNQATELASQI
jgi:hypothetical protein